MIDEERLLAWLRDRSGTNQALVGAVYQGLAERIERGQFDKEGLKPMERTEEWRNATEWRDAVLAAWERIAPSYVRADVRPLDAELRDLWQAGATPEQIAEALEEAFASSAVTKRRAVYRAFGRVWAQIAHEAEARP